MKNLFINIFIEIYLNFSETNEINVGLLVEVWCKGMLWDRALGYYYILLPEVSYSNEVIYNI
jgi:hypothetical protein